MDINRDDFFHNPYPYYAKMRASPAPFWLAQKQNVSSDGIWLFSRYQDTLQLYKTPELFSKNVSAVRAPGTASAFDLAMLHRDGADHLRLRRMVADYFSPTRLVALQPRIGKICDELIAQCQIKDEFDFISDFAAPLPLLIITELLGFPAADIPQIRSWSLDIGDGFDSISSTSEILKRQKAALMLYLDYLTERIEVQPESLPAGLLQTLLQHDRDGDIGRDELVGMLGFLLYAGHETTVHLLSNGLWLLLSHPDQMEQLRREPRLIPQAIEEILRQESPEQRTSYRRLIRPLKIRDIHLQAGEQVAMILGSANRDEAEFSNPDHFDIHRSQNRHLAFGIGIHQCIGKALSRLEAGIAFERLLSPSRSWRLASAQPNWRRNSFFRGMMSLPIRRA